jgi:lysophospholipase L1-like esterase
VNNQFSGIPFEIYANEFDELINQMIDAVGSNRIFVVSIPDYGVTPFGSNNSETIAQELDDYNEYARSRCQALNIPYINITEISRSLGASDGALASDNLHPSGIQYAEWVEEIAPAVTEIIGE